MHISSRRMHGAFRVSQLWALTRNRRILAACVALLAAIALTYGWGALTGASSTAPIVPFAVRAALSAVLIFLGAFALTGLWYSPHLDLSSAVVPPSVTAAPVAGSDTPPADADEEPVPVHVPVRAADLPRILFDTNEYPTITTLRKDAKKSGGPALHPPLRPPLAWPQHPPSDDDE